MISAVLTAFIIESYKFLKEDPQDTTNDLLRQLLAQTAGRSLPPATEFKKSAFSIRINILWFCSLVFSLFAASFGILAKQWLQSYTDSVVSSPRESARVRQFRHHGLVKWHIPQVIALLPILVQVALALFFIGLIDLLRTLDIILAGVLSTFIVLSLLFVVVTTFTPSFSQDCPHKSAQSLAVYRITQWMLRTLMALAEKLGITHMLSESQEPVTLYVYPDMFRADRRRRRASFLDHILGRHHKNWREREKDLLRDKDIQLDHQVLVSADSALMDDEFLAGAVRVCLKDTKCDPAVRCIIDIISNRAHFSMPSGKLQWKHQTAVASGFCALIHMVADVLERLPVKSREVSVDVTKTVLEHLEQLCHAFPFDPGHLESAHVYQRIFLHLSPFLMHNQSGIGDLAFTILHAVIGSRVPQPQAVEAAGTCNFNFRIRADH